MKAAAASILAAALAAAAISQSGCAVFAWTVAQFAPPQKVKALYTPPKDKKILVFVDDVHSQVTYQPVKAELTDRLNAKLTDRKIAGSTIPYRNLAHLAVTGEGFDAMRVVEVGRHLGADLVLYVHIDKFSLRDDEQGPLWRGRLGATIRMVDVEKGRLWPLDSPAGYAVPTVEPPPVDDSSPSYGAKLAKDMAEEMAERIACCFYDHTLPAEGTWPKE